MVAEAGPPLKGEAEFERRESHPISSLLALSLSLPSSLEKGSTHPSSRHVSVLRKGSLQVVTQALSQLGCQPQ